MLIDAIWPYDGQETVSKVGAWQCPRHKSNMRMRFRKPLLYPLSYGGLAGG